MHPCPTPVLLVDQSFRNDSETNEGRRGRRSARDRENCLISLLSRAQRRPPVHLASVHRSDLHRDLEQFEGVVEGHRARIVRLDVRRKLPVLLERRLHGALLLPQLGRVLPRRFIFATSGATVPGSRLEAEEGRPSLGPLHVDEAGDRGEPVEDVGEDRANGGIVCGREERQRNVRRGASGGERRPQLTRPAEDSIENRVAVCRCVVVGVTVREMPAAQVKATRSARRGGQVEVPALTQTRPSGRTSQDRFPSRQYRLRRRCCSGTSGSRRLPWKRVRRRGGNCASDGQSQLSPSARRVTG